MIERMIDFVKRLFGLGLPCMFHTITGLYCPGCGGTRAVKSLLQGDLRMSVQYHPLILYIAAVAIAEVISLAISRIFHRPELYIRRYSTAVFVGAGIVVLNWLFKNYMLMFRGVDLLPLM